LITLLCIQHTVYAFILYSIVIWETFITQQKLKQIVAQAALLHIEENSIVGVGSGSTMQCFIEALASIRHRIQGTVASSVETENQLKAQGIPVFNLNGIDELSIYVDSADAFTEHRQLVKGGGGALTREKILAAASPRFLCIVEASKKVAVLGEFPIAIEVIPMARSFVAREIVKLGGQPIYRQNYLTDNGNVILDVHQWVMTEPIQFEHKLNNIAGVVCNGIFASRPADTVLVGNLVKTAQGNYDPQIMVLE